MIIQTKFFKYGDEAKLNKFFQSAHLYHTESVPAVQFKESGVVVVYTEQPGDVPPLVASETVYSMIRGVREVMVEDEMKLRQFKWRIQKKQLRIEDIRKEISDIDAELEKLSTEPTPAKDDREAKEALKEKRGDLDRRRNKLNKELNGDSQGKEAGLIQQIENAEEHNKAIEEKQLDRQKDIDAGLEFIKEIENGEYKIYRQK